MDMNPVVHFEMPYEDRERMVQFYTKAFGWKPHMLGEEMGNYVVVETGETDSTTRRPLQPGMINGGFFKKNSENAHPSVVIGIKDIQQAMKDVVEAGGRLSADEPYEIPGTGLYIGFVDTEGNKVSLIQPNQM